MSGAPGPAAAGRPAPSGDSPPRTAGDMVARGRAWLAARGRDEARLEAELLVAHALGLDRLKLFLELDRPLAAREVQRARELFVRRGRGEPVAYLVGEREFYGRRFGVGPDVLVPRPETELLVDLARQVIDPERRGRRGAFGDRAIAELGTGSGCLAITLALELPGVRVVASDVSEVALERARANAAALEADVELVLGDGLAALAPYAPGPRAGDEAGTAGFDLLLSNPPYVEPDDPELSADVRAHEPARALFAPAGDPDHWARRLLDEGRPLLRPGGRWIVELGAAQAERVRALADARGLDARIEPDLAGRPRVLVCERP